MVWRGHVRSALYRTASAGNSLHTSSQENQNGTGLLNLELGPHGGGGEGREGEHLFIYLFIRLHFLCTVPQCFDIFISVSCSCTTHYVVIGNYIFLPQNCTKPQVI